MYWGPLSSQPSIERTSEDVRKLQGTTEGAVAKKYGKITAYIMAEIPGSLPIEPALESLPPVPGPSGEGFLSEQKPMSKNALKKAAKNERFAALKLVRRAREKEAKKEKKRLKAEKRSAGELDDEDHEEENRRSKKRKVQFGGTVVVDLGFDDMMNEKEIKSLCAQLAYTHSTNRHASFPFSLICTSLNGRTYERLEALGDASYRRWTNTKWWSEGYDRLWNTPHTQTDWSRAIPGKAEDAISSLMVPDDVHGSPTNVPITGGEAPESLNPFVPFPKDKVVYLTADTEDELVELKPDEVYIIGGICDHNRYKNLCLNKAKESDVRTARLPIGRYLASLPTRKVLTVNQVFDILVKWVETKDWEESLYSVIPKRKFTLGSKGSKVTSEGTVLVEEQDEADVNEVASQEEQEGDGSS